MVKVIKDKRTWKVEVPVMGNDKCPFIEEYYMIYRCRHPDIVEGTKCNMDICPILVKPVHDEIQYFEVVPLALDNQITPKTRVECMTIRQTNLGCPQCTQNPRSCIMPRD